MTLDARNIITDLAGQLGYSPNEIEAGIDFARERSTPVEGCCAPSRRFPYSQMKAARTAAHCAEISEASSVTHVRRIGLALDRSIEGASMAELRKLLTPGVKKRRADRSLMDQQGTRDSDTESN